MEVSDVPPALHHHLGTEATAGLLELFETARQKWTPDVTTAAVERFERRLGEETTSLRGEISALRLEMRDGFANLRLDLANTRFELLKWCFLFWVGQVFAVAGVVTIVVRLLTT